MEFLMRFSLLFFAVCVANVQALECKIAKPSPTTWINSIYISSENNEITLIESESQGKRVYKTKLVDLSDNRYTFNLDPLEKSGVTNMFLLFKSFGTWRLLNAGIEEKNSTMVLRAIDIAQEYKCSEK